MSSWTSLSARRNHLNSFDRDDADVAGPRGVRSGKRMHERRESLGGRGMNSEQNDPGSFQGAPTLNGDLPEVLVERQDDARFGLRPIQQRDVACSGKIHAGPQNVVAIGPKRIYDRLRKVLIGEEAHLRWKRERLVFAGEIAGVRQAGEDVLSRQARVVGEDVALRLAGRQEFEDELDGKTRPADYRLACQDPGIDDDAL